MISRSALAATDVPPCNLWTIPIRIRQPRRAILDTENLPRLNLSYHTACEIQFVYSGGMPYEQVNEVP